MTQTEFATGMAYLAAGVGKPISPEQMQVYWDLLKHLDFQLFQAAVKRSLLGLSENFLPSVGTIHRHACDIGLKLRNQRESYKRLTRDELEKIPNAQVQQLLLGVRRFKRPGGEA